MERTEQINCSVIRDLLPLYADHVLGHDSTAIVDAHLPDCPPCTAELEALRAPVPQKEKNPKRLLKKTRRRLWMILAGLLVVCLLAGIGGAALLSDPIPVAYDPAYFAEDLLVFHREDSGLYFTVRRGDNNYAISNVRMMDDIITEDGKEIHVMYITWHQTRWNALRGRLGGGDKQTTIGLRSMSPGTARLPLTRVYYYGYQEMFGGGDNEDGWSQRVAVLERSQLIWDAKTAGEPEAREMPWNIPYDESTTMPLD